MRKERKFHLPKVKFNSAYLPTEEQESCATRIYDVSVSYSSSSILLSLSDVKQASRIWRQPHSWQQFLSYQLCVIFSSSFPFLSLPSDCCLPNQPRWATHVTWRPACIGKRCFRKLCQARPDGKRPYIVATRLQRKWYNSRNLALAVQLQRGHSG